MPGSEPGLETGQQQYRRIGSGSGSVIKATYATRTDHQIANPRLRRGAQQEVFERFPLIQYVSISARVLSPARREQLAPRGPCVQACANVPEEMRDRWTQRLAGATVHG
eukprot:3170643-Pleurochrysis_carterae.AAC.1